MAGVPWTVEDIARIKRLLDQRVDYHEIARKMGRTYHAIRMKAQWLARQEPGWTPAPETPTQEDPPDASVLRHMLTRTGPRRVVDLCDELRVFPAQVTEMVEELRGDGFEIAIIDEIVCLSRTESLDPAPNLGELGQTEVVIGIVSDTHGGSKATQITALNEFGEACRKAGVEHIVHAGDAHDGVGVYKGQGLEQYALTIEEQVQSNAVNWPAGFTWHVLGGNHDHSTVKSMGLNPIKYLAQLRPDVIPYPFDQADVALLPGVDLRLWHPGGGVAYARSYRMQKFVAELAFAELSKFVAEAQEKPTIRFVVQGHFHQQIQLMFGSAICGLMAGAFAGENNLTKRMGVTPTISGTILRAWLDTDGRLKDFTAKVCLFPTIPDDWKNYRHTLPDQDRPGPLFMPKGAT